MVMKNVLVLTKYYHPVRNGLSDHTLFMVNLLRNSSYSVSVVCERSGSELANAGERSDMEAVHTYSGYVELLRAVKHVYKQQRPDVVLFQYVPHMWGRAGVAPFASLLPLWIMIRYRIPVIVYLHELFIDWRATPKPFLLALCQRLQLLMIGLSSRSLIITNHKRERLLKRGLWKKKVHRIPAGNVSGRKDDTLRKPYYAYPYMTWFGTLTDYQRLEMLVRTFAMLASKNSEVRLVLLGGFDTQSLRIQGLRELAASYGIDDRVIIRGFVDDDELSDTLYGSIANIYVETSGPSGRRGVIAAYLRSGRPVIAIDGAETDSEFQNDENVLLVPNQDEAAMLEAMRRVIRDNGLRERLELGVRKLYEETYSDEAILHKLVQVMDGV